MLLTLDDPLQPLRMLAHLLDYYGLTRSNHFALGRGGFGGLAAVMRDSSEPPFRALHDGTRLEPFVAWA